MLLLLWLWQGTVVQFAYRTVPYSAFKDYLRKGEVVECTVKQDVIEGKIVPKPSDQPEANTNAATASTNEHGLFATHNKLNKEFLFRTIRVEDSNLAAELEKANEKLASLLGKPK